MAIPYQLSQLNPACPLILTTFAAVLFFVSHTAAQPVTDTSNGISVSIQQMNVQNSTTLSWKMNIDLGPLMCSAGLQERQMIALSLHGSQLGLEGYSFTPGLGLLHPSTQFLSWQEANSTCITKGGVLAMPTHMHLGKKLVGLMNYGDEYPATEWAWLGATDYAEEGKWVTEKGVRLENIGPFEWYSGSNEPNGGRGENCMVIKKCSGLLGDAPCNWKLPFVCQMQP